MATYTYTDKQAAMTAVDICHTLTNVAELKAVIAAAQARLVAVDRVWMPLDYDALAPEEE